MSAIHDSWKHDLPEPWVECLALGGTLPQYVFPGGYIVLYIEVPSYDVLCATCATKALRDEAPWKGQIIHGPHQEGPSEHCADCNRELESDYGDPDAEEAAAV